MPLLPGGTGNSAAKIGAAELLQAALAGVLYGLAFPSWEGLELAPLAWFCLVPLLLPHWLQLSFVRYAALALAAGIGGSWIAGHWTFGYNGWLFGILAVVWHGLIVAPPLWLYHWQARRQGWAWALCTLPFSWVAWEWLAANWQPFFWGAIGASQSNLTWLVQFADVAGVWGVSWWVVALNAALAHGVANWAAAPKPGWRVARVLCLALLAPTLYGQWVFHSLRPSAEPSAARPTLDIALVQPAAQQADGFKSIVNLMQTADRRQWDAVVWPESIFSGMPFQQPVFQESVAQWNVPILMSFIATRPDMHRPGFADPYAAALVIDPQRLERIRRGPVRSLLEPHYRKQRLVPFTELQLLPDSWLLRWPWLKAYTPSRMRYEEQEAQLLTLTSRQGADYPIGTLICYEAVFPHLSAQAVRAGAQALFVLANDIHFGPTEAWQAASFSRLRAIETRTPVVRTSTSGVVGALDALGRWQLHDHSRAAGIYPVRVELGALAPTLYVRWGDWLPKIGVAVLILMAGVAVGSRVGMVLKWLRRT